MASPPNVAIIGAGPAGCALACFLKARDIDCIVFDNSKSPSLLVGESLVPAAIPILRRLGIEQEVARISQLKRGAALRHANGTRVDFEFRKFGKTYPDYAYNIPRPQFDALVRQRAEQLGVQFVQHKANVVKTDSPERELSLDTLSLSKAGLNPGSHPQLLIDATGRSRLFSRVLKLPAVRGQRNDIAHFAHFKNFSADTKLDGQVVLTTLECGWSWQIPLPAVTSVGVVMNAKAAKYFGGNPRERLENAIKLNPLLQAASEGSQCVSHTMSYSNYQLLSEQAYGKGWVLLGDALGFVDPMLSPGVFMTLESASQLDQHLFSTPYTKDSEFIQRCESYFTEMRTWHTAWSRLIEHFYSGEILSLGETRNHIRTNASLLSLSKYAEKFVSRTLSKLVSGAGTRSKFNHKVLAGTFQHNLKNKSTQEIADNQIQSVINPAELEKLSHHLTTAME